MFLPVFFMQHICLINPLTILIDVYMKKYREM